MRGMPFTKIYATIGPSTWDKEVLTKIVANGLTVARINASFADAKEIARVTALIREVSPRVAVLVDTMGHKIRVTGFEEDKELIEGEVITLASDGAKVKGDNVIRVTYQTFAQDIEVGSRVLIDDGNLQLIVDAIEDNEVFCKVKVGGTLKKRKTVNLPDIHLNFPSLPEKDLEDIKAAVENGADLIAASFVRNVEDIRMFREAMGDSTAKLIAKIEDYEGVENFDEILEVVDGIMIARGDLGVEEPLSKIPLYQKIFTQKCREHGKFAIVATQMLESMTQKPRATRAEISDVANAVMDGADAIMLSAESSTGKFPVEAVTTMKEVSMEMEQVLEPAVVYGRTDACELTDELCLQIPDMIEDLNLKAVIIITTTGKSVKSLSRHRLNVPIFAISTNPQLIRQMHTYRGVFGFYLKDIPNDRDTALAKAIDTVYASGAVDINDRVAVLSGSKIKGKKLNTILELVEVGDVIKYWSK